MPSDRLVSCPDIPDRHRMPEHTADFAMKSSALETDGVHPRAPWRGQLHLSIGMTMLLPRIQVSEFACRALRSLLASSWPGAGSSGPEVARLFPNLVAQLEERLEASLKECGGEEGDEHNVLRECTPAPFNAFIPCHDHGDAGRGY